MIYNVILTEDAELQLDKHINYLIYALGSKQAARNLLNDFEKTIAKLSYVAGSLSLCCNPKLKVNGYRRINFQKHRYFLLYRLAGSDVIVDAVFHDLQDFEKLFI